MSHVTDVTCHKYKVPDNDTKYPMYYIFLESSCKIQFNDPDKNVTYHMCYMSNVTDVKCHKYKVPDNVTKYQMCYIFLESSWKSQFNVHDKNLESRIQSAPCLIHQKKQLPKFPKCQS